MCRIPSRFLLQRLKESMSGDALDLKNIETRSVIKFFFFLQGKALKEIHAILTETSGEHHRRVPPSKNWVAQFKRGDKSNLQFNKKPFLFYFLPFFPFFFLSFFLSPWSRVLLEKLTGSQLFKKFPTFYGTRRAINAFTSARELCLS